MASTVTPEALIQILVHFSSSAKQQRQNDRTWLNSAFSEERKVNYFIDFTCLFFLIRCCCLQMWPYSYVGGAKIVECNTEMTVN